MMELQTITRVVATNTPGVLQCYCTIEDHGETETDVLHTYSANDPNGGAFSASVGQWLADNEGIYEVEPYTPLPPRYRIAKTTPWLRMTDPEAASMETAMNAAPARLRQIYAAATYLNSADELWPTLRGMLVQQFGQARADELLAPEM